MPIQTQKYQDYCLGLAKQAVSEAELQLGADCSRQKIVCDAYDYASEMCGDSQYVIYTGEAQKFVECLDNHDSDWMHYAADYLREMGFEFKTYRSMLEHLAYAALRYMTNEYLTAYERYGTFEIEHAA